MSKRAKKLTFPQNFNSEFVEVVDDDERSGAYLLKQLDNFVIIINIVFLLFLNKIDFKKETKTEWFPVQSRSWLFRCDLQSSVQRRMLQELHLSENLEVSGLPPTTEVGPTTCRALELYRGVLQHNPLFSTVEEGSGNVPRIINYVRGERERNAQRIVCV